jgi:hydrogenase 3 maturation protease
VVVGVGSRLRSDDALGLEIAERIAAVSLPDVLVVLGDTAPENVTGEIRRFSPTHVLFVDAADLGEAPGTARVFAPSEIEGMTSSTHTLPLHVIADYLTRETGCRVFFLGVQPKSVAFGGPISGELDRAIEEVVAALHAVLGQPPA